MKIFILLCKGGKHMQYNFQGKNITIPDSEIEKSIKILQISKDEAVQLWLEDNDFCENEEVNQLTQKAKENKAVQHGAGNALKKRNPTKKERKPDIEKEEIIEKLTNFLISIGIKADIMNKSKIIQFQIGENRYKLDLIKQRPPKQ